MNAKVMPTNTIKASFPVRRMDFGFTDVPRYWADNHAGLTHYMTALSALFPDGEKLFVDSVRAVRNDPRLADPRMQKEISAFIGQEAMHSKEHAAFNHSANLYGYDVGRFERFTGRYIAGSLKTAKRVLQPFGFTSEMIDLTATCALEHFTATIASELLTNSDVQNLFKDPTMYKLWMWHAVEENEHKAVVYDVYTALYGRGAKAYFMRSTAMVLATVLIFIAQSYFVSSLMRQDKKLFSKDMLFTIKFMYGRNGFMTRQIPELLAFFRPSFHPNDFDTNALLAKWKQQLGFEPY